MFPPTMVYCFRKTLSARSLKTNKAVSKVKYEFEIQNKIWLKNLCELCAKS
jgi:hypothetical protein